MTPFLYVGAPDVPEGMTLDEFRRSRSRRRRRRSTWQRLRAAVRRQP